MVVDQSLAEDQTKLRNKINEVQTDARPVVSEPAAALELMAAYLKVNRARLRSRPSSPT